MRQRGADLSSREQTVGVAGRFHNGGGSARESRHLRPARGARPGRKEMGGVAPHAPSSRERPGLWPRVHGRLETGKGPEQAAGDQVQDFPPAAVSFASVRLSPARFVL